MNEYPAIAELLPHTDGMRLLARILSSDAERTRCAVRVEDAQLFQDAEGRVPAWLAIEWMAQCIGVHGGLLSRRHGEPPRVGFLVGARGIVFHVPHFATAEELVVDASPRRNTAGLFDFGCRVERAVDGAVCAEGRVQCFVQESNEALRRMGWKEGRS